MDINQVLPEVRSSASAINNASIFGSQHKDNTNLIASQMQMHFWIHNVTCFKYDYNKTKC